MYFLRKTNDSFNNWNGKYSLEKTFTHVPGSSDADTAVFTIDENDSSLLGYSATDNVGVDASTISNRFWYSDLNCLTSDWLYGTAFNEAAIEAINFTDHNYEAFGHWEFEQFYDGTQEYYQYLIPRVDQNDPDVKEGYLATVVCAEVWNADADPIENY